MEDPALREALKAFGLTGAELPKRPIVHGTAGTLLSFALPSPRTNPRILAVWVGPEAVQFLGPKRSFPIGGPSEAHHLSGDAAALFDQFAEAAREFHEAVEALDSRVSEIEATQPSPPSREIWSIQREVAYLRAQIGRASVVSSECAGPLGGSFPGLREALPSLQAELDRVEELAGAVQQSLSDLILLQNALDSNRIAEAANELSRTSNRIAELANISNIRMLGLTYVALVLGLVSAVVLIPNTAATILGMPSAGWVPGLWVDAILVVLAVLPMVLVFSRPWVRRVLESLRASEGRATEGVADLPERVPPASRTEWGRNPDRPAPEHR